MLLFVLSCYHSQKDETEHETCHFSSSSPSSCSITHHFALPGCCCCRSRSHAGRDLVVRCLFVVDDRSYFFDAEKKMRTETETRRGARARPTATCCARTASKTKNAFEVLEVVFLASSFQSSTSSLRRNTTTISQRLSSSRSSFFLSLF